MPSRQHLLAHQFVSIGVSYVGSNWHSASMGVTCKHSHAHSCV